MPQFTFGGPRPAEPSPLNPVAEAIGETLARIAAAQAERLNQRIRDSEAAAAAAAAQAAAKKAASLAVEKGLGRGTVGQTVVVDTLLAPFTLAGHGEDADPRAAYERWLAEQFAGGYPPGSTVPRRPNVLPMWQTDP